MACAPLQRLLPPPRPCRFLCIVLALIQIFFDDGRVLKKIPPRVKPIRRKRESLIVPQTRPTFHRYERQFSFRRRGVACFQYF